MRITPITPGTQPELAALEAQISAARGRVSPLYQVLLNSPPIAQGWEQMLSAVRNHNSLPAALRELVILRVAVLNGASYEFEAHAPIARAAGLSEVAIENSQSKSGLLANEYDHGKLSNKELICLQMSDAMTQNIAVPDALYVQVRAEFSVQQQLDLVATIAAYNMVSRLLVALQIGH